MAVWEFGNILLFVFEIITLHLSKIIAINMIFRFSSEHRYIKSKDFLNFLTNRLKSNQLTDFLKASTKREQKLYGSFLFVLLSQCHAEISKKYTLLLFRKLDIITFLLFL